MNDVQQTPDNLIGTARDLLSAYLDDETTAAERDLVEQALAQSPQLQNELADLEQVTMLLSNLPRAAAPRPFTLTEADAGLVPPVRKPRAWWRGWPTVLAGLTAVLLVVMAAGNLWLNMMSGGLSMNQQEVASVSMMEAPAAEAPPPAAMEREAPVMADAPSAQDVYAEDAAPVFEAEMAAEAVAGDAPSQVGMAAEPQAVTEAMPADEAAGAVDMVVAESELADGALMENAAEPQVVTEKAVTVVEATEADVATLGEAPAGAASQPVATALPSATTLAAAGAEPQMTVLPPTQTPTSLPTPSLLPTPTVTGAPIAFSEDFETLILTGLTLVMAMLVTAWTLFAQRGRRKRNQ